MFLELLIQSLQMSIFKIHAFTPKSLRLSLLDDCLGQNAVLNLDGSVLDMDQVENLIKFCPTKEEMDMLKVRVCDFRGLSLDTLF